MILFKTVEHLQQHLKKAKELNQSIGFVPTMGALHQGHLSLIAFSKKECNITVCSIFVNPAQFNDSKDFEKYPVTIEDDILLLEKSNCDILFLPSVKEIYPSGTDTGTEYPIGEIENILEGAFRPGHFQGVCKVVHKLLDIVRPQQLFMGQKDYQQCKIITRLLDLTNLKQLINLNICPTLREPSGLAMSSRNMRLSKEEQNQAKAIFQSLQFIRENVNKEPVQLLIEKAEQQLVKAHFDTIDYVAIVNANTLSVIHEWDEKTPLVALIAAYLNGVRLIDNMPLN
jgi:pantoate--beta-alanine ligase